MNREKMVICGARYGDRCEEVVIDAWLTFINVYSKLNTDIEKITQTNKTINSYVYYYDDPIDSDDYIWVSPLHCLTLESGDSNNIATVKMITLLELGFTEDQLRMYRVKAVVDDKEFLHTVLGVHLNNSSDPLILDAITENVEPLSSRTELTPIFAFNKKNVWIDNQLTDNDAKTYVPSWGICVDLINEELF